MRTEKPSCCPPPSAFFAGRLGGAGQGVRSRQGSLAGGARDPVYNRLFTRIVLTAPAPIGVGRSLEATADSEA